MRPADPAELGEAPTLRQVSKTERALTSSEADDALEELFDAAASSADTELDVNEADAELLDTDHDLEYREVDRDHEADQDDEQEAESVVTSDDEFADLDADLDVGDGLDDADEDDDLDEDDEDDGPTAELRAPTNDDRVDDAPTPVNEPVITGPATRADPDTDGQSDEDVSDRILEELRRADIDGPVVAFAPQDDTTTARRRPKQSADYDPAPVPIPAKVPRVLGRKARVRKVTRVVRHVDPWSVFKIALVAFVVMYVIVLTASVLLWNVAYATGTIDNVERFFESFGWNSFEFNGGELYHAGWIAGLFVVIGLTGLAVLSATLFNLITDLVGGVRFTVLEEEVVETRTSPMRRFVVRRAEPEVPAVIRDSSGAMYREAVVDDGGANARPTR